MMEERSYTVDEANELLPQLTRSLATIRHARQTVLSAGQKVRRFAPRNGGGTPGKDYWEALSMLRREVGAITQAGIVLRDAEKGVVDFPTRLGDDDVYLCWRLGEDRVGHWHGPETGFSGRKPLAL